MRNWVSVDHFLHFFCQADVSDSLPDRQTRALEEVLKDGDIHIQLESSPRLISSMYTS
jgi:hypothetical protein